MTKNDIRQLLEQHPDKRERLYSRGFVLTDDNIDDQSYPFFGLWQKATCKNLTLLTAPRQRFAIQTGGGKTVLLVGHCYNPFTMQTDEADILADLLTAHGQSAEHFFQAVHQLTGVFTLMLAEKDTLTVVGDPTGMQTTYYTATRDHFYVASHQRLFGDLLNLTIDPYIRHLTTYRFYPLLGDSLPGNRSIYADVQRVVPNHAVTLSDGRATMHRFFWPKRLERSIGDIADEVATILQNNLTLIARKFSRPAISMTGGCDSKTTFACAEGIYDRFRYFSYISTSGEAVDARAAAAICSAMSQTHTTYEIPADDTTWTDIEVTRALLRWNGGDVCPNNANDVRKRRFFEDVADFDIEVKSWASEIGRAYFSKRFAGKQDFGAIPTPRACTTLYKFFLHDRSLVRQTDAVFAEYLAHYFQPHPDSPIDWQEQFFWEFRVPSWNGAVITGEHRYSFDITIPYNNRHLLNLLVSAPIADRIADNVYTLIRQRLNPRVDQTGIAVTNVAHTSRRATIERLYYDLHSRFPF